MLYRLMEVLKADYLDQLKRVCVPILDLARRQSSPAVNKELCQLLQDLRKLLDATRAGRVPGAFNQQLANYVLFPLTAVFKHDRGDAVLEKTFQALHALLRAWRDEQVPEKVLKELWTLAVLKLGGPIDPAKAQDPKGKGKLQPDMADETRLAILSVLREAVSQLKAWKALNHERFGGIDDFGDELLNGTHDNPTTSSGLDSMAPSNAVLFQTLSVLLDVASTPTALAQLQLEALDTLTEDLLPFFDDFKSGTGSSSKLATIMPGTLSRLTKIALNSDQTTRRHSNKVCARALASISRLLQTLIDDERLGTGQAVTTPKSLEAISAFDPELDSSVEEQPIATIQEDRSDSIERSSTSSNDPFVTPDSSWLRHTLSNIHAILKLLMPLARHEDPSIRQGMAKLLSTLLLDSGATLQRYESLGVVAEGILLLSRDHWPAVSQLTSALVEASRRQNGRMPSVLVTILESRLSALPRLIRTRRGTDIENSARIVAAALDGLPSGADILPHLDRLLWPLLFACAFDRPSASAAWSSVDETEWPRLELREVKDHATRADLEAMFASLGRWASTESKETQLVEMMLGISSSRMHASAAETSLWVLDCVSGALSVSKKTRKALNSVARAMIAMLAEHSSPSDTKVESSASQDTIAAQDSRMDVEIVKGANKLVSLDALSPVAVNTDSTPTHLLRQCLALKLLATVASKLGDEFEPFLLETTYHVLAASSSPIMLLAAHGSAALSSISYSTSYASSTNLVLANADYVFNSISLRLAPARLDLSAPSVLQELIRLGGKEVLPMVEDVVLDVLDMIDDYHGYEELCQALWGVLDAVIEVAHVVEPVVSLKEKRQSAIEDFRVWYEATVLDMASAEDLPEINPERPFVSDQHGEDREDEAFKETDEPKTPPTLAESMCIKILAKSVFFLTHQSSFLRARILRLMTMTVPILSQGNASGEHDSMIRGMQSDLLPAIDKAWPYVLLRLQENSSPPVVLAAVNLVAELARYAGDFMSKRIIEDAWPLFKRISLDMHRFDSAVYSTSAIDVQRSGPGPSNTRTWASKVIGAMCRTISDIAKSVPLKEDVVWDMAVTLRSFASNRMPDIRSSVQLLYRQLSENANADIVWTVLTASTETMTGGEWMMLESLAEREVLKQVLYGILYVAENDSMFFWGVLLVLTTSKQAVIAPTKTLLPAFDRKPEPSSRATR